LKHDGSLLNYSLNFLENGNIFISYVTRWDNFSMAIFDRNGNIIKIVEKVSSSKRLDGINDIKSCTQKNMIFLITLGRKYEENSVKIRLIDQNLNIVKKIKLENDCIERLCAHHFLKDNLIFIKLPCKNCWDTKIDFTIFNKDLEEIDSKTVDLENHLYIHNLNDSSDSDAFFSVDNVYVNDHNYIIKTVSRGQNENDRYFITDRTTMDILKRFEINSCANSHLYFNKYILGYESNSRTLKAHNLSGNLVKETQI